MEKGWDSGYQYVIKFNYHNSFHFWQFSTELTIVTFRMKFIHQPCTTGRLISRPDKCHTSQIL